MSDANYSLQGTPAANRQNITHPCIDVSHLPESVLDHRSPIWIGNLLLLLIETVVFAILVGSLLYLRRNFEMWPPPQVHRIPTIVKPLPQLGVSTANLLVLFASLVPVIYMDRAALHLRQRATMVSLLIFIAFIGVAIALRFKEFWALQFRWDESAYAAITWMTLGTHLVHLFVALGEMLIMAAWLIVKGLDKKHARDIRVTAIYWYWIVGIWVPLYLLIFIGPRL